MVPRRTWPAIGIYALLAFFPTSATPSTRYINGVVETTDDKPVPHVDVRVINVGGTVSSDSGEFAIPLPSQFEAGDPIIFSVRDWVVVDPFVGACGKTYLPKSSVEAMKIVVAHRGDPGLLSNQQLIQQIVQGVTSRIGPTAQPEVDHFLADQAKDLGFTVEQLKTAISMWAKNVQEPYQKGLAALYARQYPEASAYIEQSISFSEQDLVGKYSLLGVAELGQGHYASAESALRKAYALHRDDPVVMCNLGTALSYEAKYSEAAQLYRQSLTIDEETLGPEHPDVATGLNNLAMLFSHQGKYADADPLLKRALAIDEKALGPEHPSVAAALSNLGVLRDNQGKYADAEPLLERALAIDEKALGPDSPELAKVLNNLAMLYKDEARYKEAEQLYRRALAISEKVLGLEDPGAATTLNNLAMLSYNQGKYAAAEQLYVSFRQGCMT